MGLGVRWEGSIIGTALYNEGTRNRKFVPLLFGEESISTILSRSEARPDTGFLTSFPNS